jgi:hypothetical protein
MLGPAEVGLPPVDRQHLQRSPGGEDVPRLRQEPVEARGGAVLCFVDDAGVRVDAHRFVDEAAHGPQRQRLDRPDGAGGHLEAVAVGHAVAVVEADRRLFAGDPRTPRRRAAGAVADGADERRVGGHQLGGLRVEDEVGGAAPGRGVVRAAGERTLLAVDLVVADEADGSARPREGGHAVVVVRRGPAVRHLVAGGTEADVPEALGELEVGAGRLERAVAGVAGGERLDGSGPIVRSAGGQCLECPERAGGEDAGGHGAAPQKGTAARAHRSTGSGRRSRSRLHG